MSEAVVPHMMLPVASSDIPGLVSYWHFDQAADAYTACQGQPYTLISQSGKLDCVDDANAPLGGKAVRLDEGEWMRIPRCNCPQLDVHGPEGHLTVIGWIKRHATKHGGCEFIAGEWNESQKGRQYGLFLNISVWQQRDQICGHLSHVGGPTPGFRYCIDGPVGSTPVPVDEWSVVAMSYDGTSGYAWLNGVLDARPGLNPYSMAGGLHDGGEHGSDFTVGAVDRSGTIGNFFSGLMAGLAVYNRALTPAEIYILSKKAKSPA
jgi:hypothetical protein